MHCPLDALPARADGDNKDDDDGGDDDDDQWCLVRMMIVVIMMNKNLDKVQIPEEKSNATILYNIFEIVDRNI